MRPVAIDQFEKFLRASPLRCTDSYRHQPLFI